MEPSSAMRKRKVGWRNHWQLVVLTASVLSSCFLLTEVRGGLIFFSVKQYPKNPIERQELYLVPTITWPDLVSCQWFRGSNSISGRLIFTYYFQPNKTIYGPAFSGQETTDSDCRLYIQNLRPEDAGAYLMAVNTTDKQAEGYAKVSITENLSRPLLESSPPNGIVAEKSIDVLNCRTSNHSDVQVSWFKDGQPLPPATGDLSNLNRTLTLSRVAKSTTGTYRCRAKNFISNVESNPIQILVTYGPEIQLNPEGTIHKSFQSDLVMECLVDSIPEAKLEWFFNGIKQKETGSIFQVRLSERNNEGSYTCRATNPFTNQSDERTSYVILTKGERSAGVIAGIVIGSLAGVALFAGLLYFLST